MIAIGASFDLDRQAAYWNTNGAGKEFTHPIRLAWLDAITRESRVLDYGCGYGRALRLLYDFRQPVLAGVDIAPTLVQRARPSAPAADVRVLTDPPRVAYADASFDVALLLAVLTCVPSDDGQRDLVREIHRVVRPGGLVYVSDVLLQADARNLARYDRFARDHDLAYGTFRTDDGAICRHHERRWLYDLFAEFEIVDEVDEQTPTMNAHTVRTTQLLLRRP